MFTFIAARCSDLPVATSCRVMKVRESFFGAGQYASWLLRSRSDGPLCPPREVRLPGSANHDTSRGNSLDIEAWTSYLDVLGQEAREEPTRRHQPVSSGVPRARACRRRLARTQWPRRP